MYTFLILSFRILFYLKMVEEISTSFTPKCLHIFGKSTLLFAILCFVAAVSVGHCNFHGP